MAADLLTVQDLIDRFDGGEEALRRFAGTDPTTGSYDADRVARAIAAVSQEIYGILLAGFETTERVQALVAGDEDLIDRGAQLVRYRLTVFKDDFRLPDGRSVFASDARDARDVLRAKASSAERSAAEELPAVGKSSLIRPRATAETPPRTFTGCGF